MRMRRLPRPEDIGLPEKFREWRPHQAEAILDLYGSEKRFSALVAPTGSGKSATYFAYALLAGGRTCILTSSRALQTQLVRDFGGLKGFADVRGQANYPCHEFADLGITVAEAPCHGGMHCPQRDRGCAYYDAVRQASRAEIVVTNYAFWLTHGVGGPGIGSFDTLVMDECVLAADELAGFLSVGITDKDAGELLGSMQVEHEGWSGWARAEKRRIVEQIDQYDSRSRAVNETDARLVRRLREMERKLERLAGADENDWVVERVGRSVRWDPIDPSPLAEKLLFRGVKRIVMPSATVTSKTLSLMGLKKADEYDFNEYPSVFPVERRPVMWVKTARIDNRAGPDEYRKWHARIDEIVSARADRKGVIHSVSYDRARQIVERSINHGLLRLHHREESAVRVVEGFKAQLAPGALVSPAVMTGFDFPMGECEYQIVAKIPFPDQRARIQKARAKKDKHYGAYLAMQSLVQACGRGVRSERDRCETFIVDDHAEWVVYKYRAFAPKWWHAAYRKRTGVPQPPPRLAEEFAAEVENAK